MNRIARVRLSPRLQMVADMVRKGVTVADIGTDHAYIPVYLLQNKICPGAVAADLREKPLENARATIQACGLDKEIKICLSNGLDNIQAHEAADVIFAGMGGDLIAELAGRAVWLKDSAKHLILQPMTHAETVRAFLCGRGFKILSENACFEDNRCYIAICAAYDPCVSKVYPPAYYYLGELPACGNAAAREYISRLYKRLKKRADGLDKSGQNPEEAVALREIIREIPEVCNE